MRLPLLSAALFLAFAPGAVWAQKKHTPPPAFAPALPWITDLNLALEESRKTGAPILAEFR